MWYRRSIVLFAALLSFSAGIAIASEKAAATVFDAVIKLSASVPGDTRTAKSLGTEPQGHAVVIDSGGLAPRLEVQLTQRSSVQQGTT